jgi:hypothetical protein
VRIRIDARYRRAWRRRVVALALMVGAPWRAPADSVEALRQEYVRRRFRRLVEQEWRTLPTTPGRFEEHWRGVVRVSRFLEAHLEVTAIEYSRLLAIRADLPGDADAACRDLDELVAMVSGTRLHRMGPEEPTTPANFREHWDSMKSLVLSLRPDERRGIGVTYGRLVRLRGQAARDPGGAAEALDAALREARKFLGG